MGFQDFIKGNSLGLLNAGIGLVGGRTAEEQASGGLMGFRNGLVNNRTMQYLQKSNPELAQAVQSGAMDATDAFKLHVQEQMAAKAAAKAASMPDRKWVELADGSYGWADANSGEFKPLGKASKPNENGNKFGMTPVYGQDENGNVTIMQLTGDGQLLPSQTPKGFTPLSPYDKSYQTSQGTAAGKGAGEAAVAAPGAIQMAQQIDTQIQELKNDSSLPNVLGPMDSLTPNILPGSVRAQARIDQLKGGAFLQARQMLKGGGAITDYEGQKAENAFVRLNQAQSPEDFNKALDEFNAAVQEGARKLQAQGQAPQSQGGQKVRVYNPATGMLE